MSLTHQNVNLLSPPTEAASQGFVPSHQPTLDLYQSPTIPAEFFLLLSDNAWLRQARVHTPTCLWSPISPYSWVKLVVLKLHLSHGAKSHELACWLTVLARIGMTLFPTLDIPEQTLEGDLTIQMNTPKLMIPTSKSQITSSQSMRCLYRHVQVTGKTMCDPTSPSVVTPLCTPIMLEYWAVLSGNPTLNGAGEPIKNTRVDK